jgi:transcriptional regulator with XRE-family HTH domain
MERYRSTLGGFLRARRDERRPEEFGIEPEYGRRVKGLRRDEVAALAGISSEYYVRLEQGRVDTPSRQVIDAIVRGLRLDAVCADHMYRLAGIGSPRATDLPPQSSEALDTVLTRWKDTPAYLMDRNMDIVAANRLMTAISGGAIRPGVNAVELTFTQKMIDANANWETLARESVGALRYLGDETSSRYQVLLHTLMRDEVFARIWARNEVHLPLGHEVRCFVEGIGHVCIDFQNFTPAELSGYTVTVYTAEPGSFTESVLHKLAESMEPAA